MGGEGVTISDALETAAVEHFGTPAEAAVAGAAAGTDLLLYARLGPAMEARRGRLVKLRSRVLGRAAFVAAVERVPTLRPELPL